MNEHEHTLDQLRAAWRVADRDRKAYSTFDPTIGDPDQCPF